MKIQYASDLHLEFPENYEYIKKNPIKPIGEILILAGDIIPFEIVYVAREFFNYVSKNFKQVYWLPGNHEYYGYDLALKTGRINEKVLQLDNVTLINNESIFYDDYRLIFSILWSYIKVENEIYIKKCLNDFRLITFKKQKLTVETYNQNHLECCHFLQKEVSQIFEGKTIVVTHHRPTFLNYNPLYKTDSLNNAFASELYDFIQNNHIDNWIYGHDHYNLPSFKIDKTELLTNQLGYVMRGENKGFSNKTI